MGLSRFIAWSIWAYAVVFALLMGGSLPSFVQTLPIDTDRVATGILLIFLTIPIVLLLGFARARWRHEPPRAAGGFFASVFGEQRAAEILEAVRPAILLMIVSLLIGGIGVARTFLTTQSSVSYCLSSYFLAVGLGNLYSYLGRNRA